MKKSILHSLVLSLLALLFVGCGINKVYNVETKNFSTKPQNQTVYNAIIQSGKFLGWSMKQTNENTIIGKLVIRDHVAKVSISFDKDSYSIKLLEAENLNYDSSKNTIHKNYNGWVKNLENQIDAKLTPLKMTSSLIEAERLSNEYKKNPLAAGNNKYKPIYNVVNKKINKNYNSLSQVEEKILNAGEKISWVMSKQEDGFILAKVVRRVHTAFVRIDYSLDSYSITYITSEKLGADTHYNIHNNYNIWIKELEEEIDFSLQ